MFRTTPYSLSEVSFLPWCYKSPKYFFCSHLRGGPTYCAWLKISSFWCFFPLRVNANSSVSSGITNAVDSISYAGVSTYIQESITVFILRQYASFYASQKYSSLFHHSLGLVCRTTPTLQPKRFNIWFTLSGII